MLRNSVVTNWPLYFRSFERRRSTNVCFEIKSFPCGFLYSCFTTACNRAAIREEFAEKVLTLDGDSKYRLVGLPFYNNTDENEFKDTLQSALGVKS
jgi:hypothetical protein